MDRFIKLYKYQALYSCAEQENSKEKQEKNNRNLFDLCNRRIWLSMFEYLNDPFEAQAFYYDNKQLHEKGLSKDKAGLAEWVINYISSKYVVYSMTENSFNSMPMWAHYGNNHSGICIEYELDRSLYTDDSLMMLDQVEYKSNRIAINSFIGKVSRYYKKISPQGDMPLDNENLEDELEELTRRNYFTKHDSWAYEREWRILYTAVIHGDYPNGDPDAIDANLQRITEELESLYEQGGMLLNTDNLGMKVTNIYLGMRCDNSNKELVANISRELGCGLYQIIGKENKESYSLGIKKLIW